MTQLSDEDEALCVAWLDGQLDERARLDFELRLASDPELTASVQALLETDELLRRLEGRAAARLARVHRLRPWAWAVSVAAGLLALFFVARSALRAPGPAFEVAVAPGFESAREFVETVPELRGLRPPGLDVLRGENEPPNVDAATFAAKAAEAERAIARSATSARTVQATAGYFVLPLRLREPCEVVAIAFTRSAERHELLAPGKALEPGLHVLPLQRFTLAEGEPARVRYERGFLVPVGAGELDVLVGVRGTRRGPAAPPGAAATADEQERALEATGFTVRRLKVREPKD